MHADKRFIGYVRVLEQALTTGEISRLFHLATARNVADVLTTVMHSMALQAWLASGQLTLAPGEYGARAEARQAARRAATEAARQARLPPIPEV